MDSPYAISDDDDSFSEPVFAKPVTTLEETISISSDEEPSMTGISDSSIEVDIDGLPTVNITQRNNAIKQLFKPKNNVIKVEEPRKAVVKDLFPSTNRPNYITLVVPPVPPANKILRWIEGVQVSLPVVPYGSQIALMSKIIKGLKEKKNCILESPTGSGKTLALLCGVLSWQLNENERISKEESKNQASAYFSAYPELQNKDVTDYVASSPAKKSDVTPEKLFSRNRFGEKSIYQKPEGNLEAARSTSKRVGPYADKSDDESSTEGLVSIHKKRRQGSVCDEDVSMSLSPVTPVKSIPNEAQGTPEHVRKLYDLVTNLRVRTAMVVDCSVPTIYYGTRTHSQLQQVIKEFKRTSYCGQAKMTLLSSRDKSCIREFNRDQWSTKNDMCRDCITSTTVIPSNEIKKEKKEKGTKCQYYDRRRNIAHHTMPPAFDLEELIEAGHQKMACPYYGAREMAKTADIIFCPYNYLIDPSIRSNLQINLDGAILVIDEAHNIENICRDAASLSITQVQIQSALKELQVVAEYRFANQDVLSFIEELIVDLKNWNEWFINQTPLVQSQPLTNNSATYEWAAKYFVDSLGNHNIGFRRFHSFKANSEVFCRKLRDDPRTLYGVTQATGTLLEALAIVFGYVFRDECQYMDDFKPVLERQLTDLTTYNDNRRKSKGVPTDLLTLHLHCLNAAIVMQSLQVARSIILSSGTLTPMGNLHAELGTPFPLAVSPNHVISVDRVWIGVVAGDSQGNQAYTMEGSKGPLAGERLGRLVLRVCDVTPHGVLCFLTSYSMLYKLRNEWKASGIWSEMAAMKHVFCEQRNSNEHEDMMKEFYDCVGTTKGALLFAVYRGKVSEGMDFKDHQARAVICMGIPYPSRHDVAVKAKMEYNDRHRSRGLLPGSAWLTMQAFRALNQAAGRCVRHRQDWGSVVLADCRYLETRNTEQLSRWLNNILGRNHHTLETVASSLEEFVKKMKISEEESELNLP